MRRERNERSWGTDGRRHAASAALAAQEEAGAVYDAAGEAALSRVMVERVLTACAHLDDAQAHQLMALLRRFETEAAREEARRAAAAPAEEPVFTIDFAALEAEILEAA